MSKSEEGCEVLLNNAKVMSPYEILEMPRGTPVVEFFARAERLFGLGFLIDQRGQVCTSTGAGSWPHVHGPAEAVKPFGANADGVYWFTDFAKIAGCSMTFLPTYIVLGDPEIVRVYLPRSFSPVFIDRSKLGDWGTKDRLIPVDGRGWWDVMMDHLAPRTPHQPKESDSIFDGRIAM